MDLEKVINCVSLFGLPLDIDIDHQDVMDRMASGKLLLTYLNPYAYSVRKMRPHYAEQLNQFDLVVCDGIGIQKAVKTLFKVSTPILTPDYSGIGHDYLRLGAEQNMSLCMVGADQDVVLEAAARIEEDHPGFRRISAYGGFGESPAEAKEYILQSEPDMVLAGMGMGAQEAYLLELLDAGWTGIGICVGGFFDKLANPDLEYPEWSEKIGLRFLGRISKEPLRLSRRYFVDYQPFIMLYLKHLISSR